MNLPNAITTGRLILAVLFFGTFSWYLHAGGMEGPGAGEASPPVWLLDLALGLFVVAAVTDWLDGFIARRMNLTTAFGRVADPLADKIIVCGAFTYFLAVGPRVLVKPWMVVMILAREFLVTGVRFHIESRGKAFGALLWGKAKMWVQCITIICVLLYLGHFEGTPWAMTVICVAVYATVIATVGSCVPYVRKAWEEARS